MDLTLEQIKSVTTGAVNIFQDNDGIHFRRFTDRQLEFFANCSAQFAHRSRCTAGCQLSFYTNSNFLFVEVAAGMKYEVWVDGLPAFFAALEKAQRLPIPRPEGRKHVVITLPNYTEGVLTGIEIDQGAYVEPYRHSRKFLFLGDSITQGSQSTRDSFCYVYRIARFFDAEIMNLGVGGTYMCAESLEDVGFDPEAVFIAYGTNDYTACNSIKALETACCHYFDKVKQMYPDKKIFYISPLWRADGGMVRKAGTLDDCREVLIRQCMDHSFIHIDGYTLVPHMPFYLNDGYLHPSDLGFSMYSQNLIHFLLQHL